jgi:hypothetical protein
MTAGYSMFTGDENRVLLTGSRDNSSWGWLMTTVKF